MRVLAIIGFCAVVVFLTVLGINILNRHDNELLSAHPPDPDHRQWPQDGDDP